MVPRRIQIIAQVITQLVSQLDMCNSKNACHASRATGFLHRAMQGLALAAIVGLTGLSQGAWAHAHVVSSDPAAQTCA
jgi:hypothetical protein